MTIDELSKLVAGKWIADNTFGDDYEPVECLGALVSGNSVNYVIGRPDQNLSVCSAIAFRNEIIYASKDACQAECDLLNKPADTYDEAEDEEEAA